MLPHTYVIMAILHLWLIMEDQKSN